jgi:anti-sigma regulatory factor (Ser/Thr protein kinase)
LFPSQPSTAVDQGDHVVQFYEHDAELVAGIGSYLIDPADQAAAYVVIATEAHRDAVVRHLGAHGIDVAAARKDGSLVLLDAASTLDRFMPDGRIDRDAFFEIVGGVIRDAARDGRTVRAYGEMVSLLWEAGDVLAAIDLEALWNELAVELPFALYCAYRSDSVVGDEHADALHDVCRLHSSVVPVPGEAVEVAAGFQAQTAAVSAVRLLVAGAVASWGHDRRLVADAALVATELATNAIVHAGSPFRVSVHRFGRVVRIMVHDRAPSLPAVLEPDPRRGSGRGMHMIAAACRRWGVDVTPDGKTVWGELAG